MREEKGFTLIELLAVIVILGVIMMIAIPSVTGYITSSRKNSLITTAKQFVTAIKNQATTTNELPTAPNETKTFGICGVELEKGGKTSPFGAEWECDKSFVAIDYDGANYSYQVQLTDKDGNYLPLTDVDDINGNLVTKEDIANIPGEEGAQKPTLASLVSQGDFVNYDAGNWTETRYGTSSATHLNPFNIPQQEFGGYTAGQSRNTSVACFYASGTYYANQYNGWRVLNSNSETGEVTLISAGTPECYHHTPGKSAESVENLKNHNWSQYVNNRYASAANVFTKTNLDTWYGSTIPYDTTITNDLIETGGFYWLAEASNTDIMWSVSCYGNVYGNCNLSFGVRVLVTLKSGIKTSGQDGSGVWQLVG